MPELVQCLPSMHEAFALPLKLCPLTIFAVVVVFVVTLLLPTSTKGSMYGSDNV